MSLLQFIALSFKQMRSLQRHGARNGCRAKLPPCHPTAVQWARWATEIMWGIADFESHFGHGLVCGYRKRLWMPTLESLAEQEILFMLAPHRPDVSGLGATSWYRGNHHLDHAGIGSAYLPVAQLRCIFMMVGWQTGSRLMGSCTQNRYAEELAGVARAVPAGGW